MKKPTKEKLRAKARKIKHISLKSLHKKAWALQSEYVRRSERGICYTCGVHKDWRDTHCGHYIHKDCLDFDNINLHCQCARCNTFLHGNTGIYAERLIAEYGEEAVRLLRERANLGKKFNIFELENKIVELKELLTTMEGEKSFPRTNGGVR